MESRCLSNACAHEAPARERDECADARYPGVQRECAYVPTDRHGHGGVRAHGDGDGHVHVHGDGYEPYPHAGENAHVDGDADVRDHVSADVFLP